MKKILIVLLFPILLSGCWDKIEINRKFFISTIGIDVGEDINDIREIKEINSKDPFQEREIKKYKITYGFPDIASSESGKSANPELKLLTTEAFSLENAIVNGTAKSSRALYFGHTKLLLISESILKNEDAFKEIMDYMERQHTMNRMMYVLLCKGNAEDFIKYKPITEKNIEGYLSGLMLNNKKNATILPVTLNELIILLRTNGNAMIPEISMDYEKKELHLSGVNVISKFKTVGTLNGVEVTDIELMRGKQQNGEKVVYIKDHPLDLEIDGVKSDLRVEENNGVITASVNLFIEGSLKSYYFGEKVLDDEFIKEGEESFNISLSNECEKVINITQGEFGVDLIKIREHIEKYNPKLYKKIEDNWEEEYKNMNIKVTVVTKIRRNGAIK